MNACERIRTLLDGKPLDRPARSLWKHFPIVDQEADSLARRTIEFQDRYDWDFVKICHHGLYSIEDWSSEIRWPRHELERGEVVRYGIARSADWRSLEPLNPAKGALGRELEVVRQVAARFCGEVPVLPTVFSPLTTAIKMRGEALFEDIKGDPDALGAALSVITDTTARFVTELVRAGADGVFFATQLATTDALTAEQYRRFGREYDLPVLEAAAGTWFNVLHIHGLEPMAAELADYPVQALNWHDRRSNVPLGEMRSITGKLPVGGIDELGVLDNAAEAELTAHLREALEACDGRLVLGPGCVVPLEVPEEAIRRVGAFAG